MHAPVYDHLVSLLLLVHSVPTIHDLLAQLVGFEVTYHDPAVQEDLGALLLRVYLGWLQDLRALDDRVLDSAIRAVDDVDLVVDFNTTGILAVTHLLGVLPLRPSYGLTFARCLVIACSGVR